MHKKIFSSLAVLLFLINFLFAQKNIELNNGIKRPKLMVGIVIDQMRWDYLYRYYNRYSEGGFKRFLNEGYSFENTIIPYAATVTAAGHTCIYTGSVPAIHGIVGNDWVERQTGEKMYCSQDKTVQTIGSSSNAGQMSPRNMLANTIGDELRRATNKKSRVYGVALKDRGAILPAGHSANAAYWFDDATGNWISSSYYFNELPNWVSKFNSQKKPDAYMNNPWNLMYNINKYDQSTADEEPWEKHIENEATSSFPHKFSSIVGKDYNSFRFSPFGNSFTFDFAKKLLESEKLGESGQTDMLCISLSSTDYLGHTFGPQSLELEDTYLRLDNDLLHFFEFLDTHFTDKDYTIFLSADHGAAYTPNFMKDSTTKLLGGNIDIKSTSNEIETALYEKYKIQNLVKKYIEYQFYLDDAKIDSAKINKRDVEQTLVEVLYKKPEVMYAFAYSNFSNTILPEIFRQKMINGYYSKRSGDVQIILKPQYTDGNGKGTDHGVAYSYDSHIPLLWYGKNIPKGKSNNEKYMTDIAPTIAAMLHIQMPSGSVGKVLEEIVK